MSKKFSFILRNNINNLVIGISFLTLLKTFFFYFSNTNKKGVGLLKIKKIVAVLNQLIHDNKRFFITKLSKRGKIQGNCFILNKM